MGDGVWAETALIVAISGLGFYAFGGLGLARLGDVGIDDTMDALEEG